MKTLELMEPNTAPAAATGIASAAEPAVENLIRLVPGLLGFEVVKDYVLLAHSEQEPFMWLQMMDGPALAFTVINPWLIRPDYRLDLAPEDARSLGLADPADAIVLAIVSVREGGSATVNLKGPLVLNRHTLFGRQVIPANAADYSAQHPVLSADDAA